MLVTGLATLAPVNSPVIVDGYYSPGDGGGGIFVYNTTLPAWITWIDPADPVWFEDGGIVIKYTGSGGGYWIRTYSGPINVRWFGAKGDYGTDDTAAVAKAIHAAEVSYSFTTTPPTISWYNTTVYFPVGQYRGHFEITRANIVGDGQQSVLYLDGISSEVLLIKGGGCSISNIQFYGDQARSGNGISFDPSNSYSGGCKFETVSVVNCDIGVLKPSGNILNTFTNCTFYGNNIGYFAQNAANMHCGADEFIRGTFQSNLSAAIYVKADNPAGYGQLILEGTVIQDNLGFGLLIVFTGHARMLANAISIRNVWMEANGGHYSGGWIPTESVTVDGTTYYAGDIVDYYFSGVRSVNISDSPLFAIKLVESSVNTYNCFSDAGDYYYIVDVDNLSSLVASELKYRTSCSENIFTHSISYDGSSDVYNINVPTSVWGPLRVITQTGVNQLQMSQRYNAKTSYEFEPDPDIPGSVTVYTIPTDGGILDSTCARINLPNHPIIAPIGIRSRNDIFYLSNDEPKYYVWSIHSFLCPLSPLEENEFGTVKGVIRSEDSSVILGQVIFKPNQWACSYGVKMLTGSSEDPTPIYLYFEDQDGGSIFKICDYQVIKFDNLYDAQSFLNSKAFAENQPVCFGE